jgi:hypothetical protein
MDETMTNPGLFISAPQTFTTKQVVCASQASRRATRRIEMKYQDIEVDTNNPLVCLRAARRTQAIAKQIECVERFALTGSPDGHLWAKSLPLFWWRFPERRNCVYCVATQELNETGWHAIEPATAATIVADVFAAVTSI